jgi:hypothetical protein
MHLDFQFVAMFDIRGGKRGNIGCVLSWNWGERHPCRGTEQRIRGKMQKVGNPWKSDDYYQNIFTLIGKYKKSNQQKEPEWKNTNARISLPSLIDCSESLCCRGEKTKAI